GDRGAGLLDDGVDRVGEERVLVGVVLVEAAAVDPGPLGDVGDRDLVEPALARELEERLLEAAPRARDSGVHVPSLAAADRGRPGFAESSCEFSDNRPFSDTCRIISERPTT